jgi:tRNA-2-methylthio-N6-dimethylallyladenosine synthase
MLDDRQTDILERKNSTLLNKTVEVLVENKHKGKWRGRTPQNKLVFFESDGELAGNLVDVQITETHAYTLFGKPIASV